MKITSGTSTYQALASKRPLATVELPAALPLFRARRFRPVAISPSRIRPKVTHSISTRQAFVAIHAVSAATPYKADGTHTPSPVLLSRLLLLHQLNTNPRTTSTSASGPAMKSDRMRFNRCFKASEGSG
ncbi:hypothetical protein D3C76_1220740 [compost metagenome]